MNKTMTKVYADGGARGNPGPAACAFVVVEDGKIIHKDSKFLGTATNNVAEYSAVLLAHEWINKNNKNLSYENIVFFLDSELVTRQLRGVYKIKNDSLKKLATKIKKLEMTLEKNVSYSSVPRSKNILADKLVNEQLDENTD